MSETTKSISDVCPLCGAPVTVAPFPPPAYVIPSYTYAPPALTDLERAVVEAAVKEIEERWVKLGYFIRTARGDRDRSKMTAHKLAVSTASMVLSNAVDALLAAQEESSATH